MFKSNCLLVDAFYKDNLIASAEFEGYTDYKGLERLCKREIERELVKDSLTLKDVTLVRQKL